jgi:hypothetical protein
LRFDLRKSSIESGTESTRLPLSPTTHEFLALVERETGYPVKLLEDSDLPTLATVRIARGDVPAHFVIYKPTRDEGLDYMICLQCGFVLRLFDNPPEQRFRLGGTAEGEREVLNMVSDPGGNLARYGLQPTQAAQMASTLFNGLMTHLLSIPVSMRVADWIYANYPALHASQRAAVLKELAEAKAAAQPQIREMTPERIFKPTMAINAAYAMFWADKYEMRELAGPYRGSSGEADGRSLLKLWHEVPSDARHDRELIDRWGAGLNLTGWYRWVPYEAP